MYLSILRKFSGVWPKINIVMTILNKDIIPVLWSWNNEIGYDPKDDQYHIPPYIFPKPTKMNWFKNLHESDKKFFIVEFFMGDGFDIFPLDAYTPIEIIEQIRNKEVYLLLCNTGHGYTYNPKYIFEHVIKKYDLPSSQIIYRSENADMYPYVVEAAASFNIDPPAVEWQIEFESKFTMDANYENFIQANTLVYKQYDKKFLSFNGLYREHRALFVMLLACLNLLEKGMISYNSKNLEIKARHIYDVMLERLERTPNLEIQELFNSHREKLLELNTLKIDDLQNRDTSKIFYEDEKNMYENTYFSIVTETHFPPKFSWTELSGYDGRLLSEKTFKPIVQKHPFMIVCAPNSLKLLKHIGYKTFHPFIDESYDEEMDDAKRILMIARETERLCNLSEYELKNFLDNIRPICEYNFEVIKNKTNFIYNLPLDI